jgi:porin
MTLTNNGTPATWRITAIALLAGGNTVAEPHDDAAAWSLFTAYTAELWQARDDDGGTHSAYLDNLDIVFDADAEILWGLDDTRIHLYGLYNNGNSLSGSAVRDLQVVSNIEAGTQAFRLYEAWVETGIGDDASLLFGLYDLNSEFDALDSAGLFINSAHGIGTDIAQSGENGPSIFPVTSLALRVQWETGGKWAYRVAVLDGVPGDPEDPGATAIRIGGDDGALLVVEGERRAGRSKLLAGGWAYSAGFDSWDEAAGSSSGNAGIYLRAESLLYDGDSELSAFGRFGWAHPEFNIFSHFASVGLAWSGFLPGRPEDTLGLAIAWARSGDEFRRAGPAFGFNPTRAETAYELTWRLPLTRKLTMQPDIQYVTDPGLDPSRGDAWAFGLRLEWTEAW